MPDLPHLPDDGVIEVGGFLVPCEVCGLPVPMTVNAFCGEDEDGDECIFTEIITLDLELHLLSHSGLAGEVPDDS